MYVHNYITLVKHKKKLFSTFSSSSTTLSSYDTFTDINSFKETIDETVSNVDFTIENEVSYTPPYFVIIQLITKVVDIRSNTMWP